MKGKRVLSKTIYFLIMCYFFFDAYFKVNYLSKEADNLRSKYPLLQDFLKNKTPIGVALPFDLHEITPHLPNILTVHAGLEVLFAALIILGVRQLPAMGLILLTFIQTFVLYNPFYRNSTEIDRQRCYKQIFSDICLIACLIMITGLKKVGTQPVKDEVQG